MTKRVLTPSFVHELPLRINPYQARLLSVRFEAGRNLYNACLGEALRRLDHMRETRLWQKARKIRDKQERPALFKKAQEKHGFSDNEMQSFAIVANNACWIGEHLDAHSAQKLATRAFDAAKTYSRGKRGRPRSKRKGWLDSLEGKANASGIRFVEDRVEWSGRKIKSSSSGPSSIAKTSTALRPMPAGVRAIVASSQPWSSALSHLLCC